MTAMTNAVCSKSAMVLTILSLMLMETKACAKEVMSGEKFKKVLKKMPHGYYATGEELVMEYGGRWRDVAINPNGGVVRKTRKLDTAEDLFWHVAYKRTIVIENAPAIKKEIADFIEAKHQGVMGCIAFVIRWKLGLYKRGEETYEKTLLGW